MSHSLPLIFISLSSCPLAVPCLPRFPRDCRPLYTSAMYSNACPRTLSNTIPLSICILFVYCTVDLKWQRLRRGFLAALALMIISSLGLRALAFEHLRAVTASLCFIPLFAGFWQLGSITTLFLDIQNARSEARGISGSSWSS